MAIRLKVKRAEGEYDLGASKFLGSPVLPSSMVDEFGGGVIFLLQLRLSDLKELDKEHILPDHGYLYFFLDTSESEYSMEAIVRYVEDEDSITDCVNNFNEVVDGYENFVDDYLIEFEECDDYETGNKLFGRPNDWNYAEEPRKLLLQFDPLDSEMGLFEHLDGLLYFFLNSDNIEDVELMEEIS